MLGYCENRGTRMANDLRILLVDDNEDFLEVLCMEVEDLGFPTVTAHNVDDALEKLAAHPVDIVVSDLHMDGKSGMDFLTALRRKHNLIPFIFLTGAATKTVAVQALRNGAFDLLEKPIETEELARVLRSAGKLVRRIQSDGTGQGAEVEDANLIMLRSSARAFDDLARDSGIKSAESSESASKTDFGGHDASDENGTSAAEESASDEKDAAAARLQVKKHIEGLLNRSETAIEQLENGQFALTALSFLCRSFNIARESADQSDDAVLAGACETACNCFSFYRVSPHALTKESILAFRAFNDFLKELNRYGAKALKKHSSTIAAVQRIEQALDEAA